MARVFTTEDGAVYDAKSQLGATIYEAAEKVLCPFAEVTIGDQVLRVPRLSCAKGDCETCSQLLKMPAIVPPLAEAGDLPVIYYAVYPRKLIKEALSPKIICKSVCSFEQIQIPLKTAHPV